MITEFTLPDVGEGIVEGEIVRWRVDAGDAIKEDQIIVEIETDKAVVEIPAPRSGYVVEFHYKNGDVVKVGESLLTIGDEKDLDNTRQAKDKGTVVGVLEEAEEPEKISANTKILILPAVRKLADDMGVDLKMVKGTGPHERITEDDINRFSEEKSGVKRDQDAYGMTIKVPLRGIRKNIAKNMPVWQQNTAHVTHMEEADVTNLTKLKEKEEVVLEKRGIKLTHLPFIIKAVTAGLKEHRLLNASLDMETKEIILKKYYNIGIAVNTEDGLMVPVIKNVDKKSIIKLAEEIKSLAENAKARSIDLQDLKGGTFTITNIGSYGGIYATPIINHPQVAIMATGKIREKPVVRNGEILIRKMLPMSITFDHRIMDGATVAQFTKEVKKHIEDPGLLLLELK